jgi:formamidopyrimidine-DNA glycosylase
MQPGFHHGLLGVRVSSGEQYTVPELPEVEIIRRQLSPVMTGAQIERVELRRPDLRAPFPRRFRSRLEGQTVTRLDRRAKYLLAELSSGATLVMHLGMSGSFRIERRAWAFRLTSLRQGYGGPPKRFARRRKAEATNQSQPQTGAETGAPQPNRHDHVVFHLSSGATVIFNDPRRFGVMDLLPPGGLSAHPVLGTLGPEPLSEDFDGHALARACAGKKTTLKVALLDQRVVSGLGNIYASEALHLAGLSPQRRASTIATPSGAPREAAHRLAAAIKQVLEEAIARASGGTYRSSRFRVYDREGARCRRRGCPGIIRRRTQAGRSTFYCGVCQR